MVVKKVGGGWTVKVWLPYEWIPHWHKYIYVGKGYVGNRIYVCKWCGKDRREG